MTTTLAQLAEASTDALAQGFINETVTDNYLLGAMTFDDCLTTNGSSNLVYGYDRIITPMAAAFRDLNSEPASTDIQVKKITTKVAILSDRWPLDRVARAANDDFYTSKVEESRNAIIRGFNKAVIAGDTTKTTDKTICGFDGLSKVLKSTSTEKTSLVDLSTISESVALAFCEELDTMLSLLMRTPDVLLVGPAMKVKINSMMRVLGLATSTNENVGRGTSVYNGITVQEMRDGAISNNDVYALCLGMDGFHGVTLAGGNAISVSLPDWSTPGAVKTGDAEFVCGIALRATKAAGVLRQKATSQE